MGQYVRRAIEIEADKYELGMEDGFTREDYLSTSIDTTNLECFLGEDLDGRLYSREGFKTVGMKFYPFLDTEEGRHYLTKGSYIVVEINGERHPMKKDVFEKTHDTVGG